MTSIRVENRPRVAADELFALSRAMIRQARMLEKDGAPADARALAGRARQLDLLGWSCRQAA